MPGPYLSEGHHLKPVAAQRDDDDEQIRHKFLVGVTCQPLNTKCQTEMSHRSGRTSEPIRTSVLQHPRWHHHQHQHLSRATSCRKLKVRKLTTRRTRSREAPTSGCRLLLSHYNSQTLMKMILKTTTTTTTTNPRTLTSALILVLGLLALLANADENQQQMQEGQVSLQQSQQQLAAGTSPSMVSNLEQQVGAATSFGGATSQFGASGSSQQAPGPASSQRQFAEISVRPHEVARIECRLPPLVVASQSNKSRQFYWNFQQTTHVGRRPELLCFGTNCLNAPNYNLELDYDQATGTYDLLISNATYELNDGTYYCDYQDSAPELAGGRQTLNREIRLTILIPPQPPTIGAVSTNPAREGQEHQLQCQSHGGNPEPNITWFKNDQVLLAGPGLRLDQSRSNGTTTSTLTWIPTIDDHQATYKCSVTNKAMSQPLSWERELTLPVEYAPRITVGPYNPLKVVQGDRATLSCQVDANPPVKGVRWYRDGHQLISNQYNHTIQETKVSDAAVYSCQADNGIAPPAVLLANGPTAVLGSSSSSPAGANGLLSFFGFSQASAGNSPDASRTLVEARLQLEILYAPRVQVRESRSLPLSEGDQLTLNCTVDSWPPAHEFIWTRQEDAQTFRRLPVAGSSLVFDSLTANDMGNYTCTAVNRLEPSGGLQLATAGQQLTFERSSSASLVVLVRHRPGVAEIHLGQNGETEQGNKTLISCRAKPPGYPEPRATFWRWAGTNLGGGGGGGKKQQMSGKSTQASSQDHSTYTIFSASAEYEGRYSCMLINELGQSSNEAVGELLVNEPPMIGPDSTWSSTDDRQPGVTSYAITVRASGKPQPRVRWFHRSPVDGRRVELSSSEMESRFKIETTASRAEIGAGRSQQNQQQQVAAAAGGPSQTQFPRPRYIVVTTLVFLRPLEVDDRGLYTVEFSNGRDSRIASQSRQLHIAHSPIPAPRNQPLLSSQSTRTRQPGNSVTKWRAGVNVGETANLTCRVSAYPMPSIVWYFNSAGRSDTLEPNPRYRTSVANPQDDIWEGTLSFELESMQDYGDYMCVSANSDTQTNRVFDSTSIVIQLGQKTAPEAPSQVEQVDASQDSVTIAWVPGFDGGFALNQYLVQYAPDDQTNNGQSLMRRFGPMLNIDVSSATGGASQPLDSNGIAPEVDQQQQQQYPKVFDCQSQNPCTIGNLAPRQTYLMRLRARNELGMSEFSDELHVSTRANFSQIPRILEAHFDSSRNKLHFRLEPNPEYLLNSLEARIEVRGSPYTSNSNQQQQQQQVSVSGVPASDQAQASYATGGEQQPETASQAGEWRRHLTVPMHHEQSEVYLNMSSDIEALRLTLCSRSSENLCGPELIVGTQGVASSFLQDQRGLSMSIVASIVFLIAVITLVATTLHSRCLSRKAKKAAALDQVDHRHGGGGQHLHHSINGGNDTKNGHVNGGLNLANGSAKVNGGSHGSTTSTNSTSATNTNGANPPNHQLQSMDSINNGGLLHHQHQQQPHMLGHMGNGNGSSSDHSSDHSRQAKLDSMLPPNYSHYADRASLMLEQQQQQLAANAYHLQPQDKLTSPFGLPASALMGGGGVPDPQVGDYFSQGANSMMLNSMLSYQDAGQQPDQHDPHGQQLYATSGHVQQQQQQLDDYTNYNNALANYQTEQQIIESAYGTAANPSGLMMAQPTQASYDNNANQSYLSYPAPNGGGGGGGDNSTDYDPTQQQQHQHIQSDSTSSQYQQGLAAAQQQMYGTLTRANNPNGSPGSGGQQQDYMSGGGLMPPPPLPPQESDYGTTGGARSGGRLIREIIV